MRFYVTNFLHFTWQIFLTRIQKPAFKGSFIYFFLLTYYCIPKITHTKCLNDCMFIYLGKLFNNIFPNRYWTAINPLYNNLIILPYGNFHIDSDEITENEIKEDSIFPEPCGNYCNSIINRTPQCTVEFVDLKQIYEKVQSRAGGGSHQRVSSGIINIKATSQGQLCAINVFVERMPEAATLCGDTNGRVLLEVNHEDYFGNQVKLDDYDSHCGIQSKLTTKQ